MRGFPLRGITVSVDYSDYLAVSLKANRPHFSECWVVTSPADGPNVRRIAEPLDCRVHVTDVFYARGARFNKWAALEEGLDRMGRHGWVCLWDADTVWPSEAPLELEIGTLYGPMRRIWHPAALPAPKESEWAKLPLHENWMEWPGFTQIFHAADPALGPAPWHETDWTNAGSADSFFQLKWGKANKKRLGWEVLHMGEAGVNWDGRVTPYLDGAIPEGSEERRRGLLSLLAMRGGEDRFRHEKINKEYGLGD